MKSLNSRIFSTTYLDALLAFGLGIGSLALYIHTLAPSLLFGDSAEFQTIAYTSGIGHPTGYPIYILLAKLFTFLPVGDLAYRVNLFSAFCGALTVALIYLSLRKLGAWRAPAAIGALVLALAALFWKHATIAEVYTTSAACIAIILFSVLTWNETNNPRWLFIAGLFGGLSLGIHTTVALGGIAILLFLVLSTRKRADWLHVLTGAISGLVIFILAFLFLDRLDSSAGYYNAVVRPSLSVWMNPAGFDSPFERLTFLYFPPQFQGQFFNVPVDEVKTRLIDFAAEESWYLLLALLGLISLRYRSSPFVRRKDSPWRWREAILLLAAFLTFLVFAITYNVSDFYVFYIPALLVMSVFIGLGVSSIVEAVAKIPIDLDQQLPRAILVLLSLVILFAGFMFLESDDLARAWTSRLPPMTDEWESYFYKFPEGNLLETEQILNSLEDNAIVFTGWDTLYKFYYIAHVLQGRLEMDFHETYPQEGVTQLAVSALEYIEANIDTRPIYFTERPSQLVTHYKVSPAGAGLYQITEKK